MDKKLETSKIYSKLMKLASISLCWKSSEILPSHEEIENQDNIDQNTHLTISPICGWLLPNHLDGTLMVFDQKGKAIGTLGRNNKWRVIPGNNFSIRNTDEISNPHLRRVMHWINNKGTSTNELKNSASLDSFILKLDAALENIDTDYLDSTFLMSKPLAVVRASLNIEFNDLTNINHSSYTFLQDIRNKQSLDEGTNEMQEFQLSVRLSKRRELNDGLVGYWLEDNYSELDPIFYAPNSDIEDSESDYLIPITPLIPGSDKKPRDERLLTMLLNPEGQIYASNDVLQTISLGIPKSQYLAALETLKINFTLSPILDEQKKTNEILPLSDESGYLEGWLTLSKAGNKSDKKNKDES
jgi:hypothetical protein